MVTGSRSRRGQVRRRLAFTLIELLVVVAIIGLLVSILLPSLRAARAQAKAAVCGSNMRGVGQAIAGYLAESKATFPTSYEYLDNQGRIIRNGADSAPAGYLHWSYALWQGNQAGEEAFECPEIPNGGHPRTNPGPLEKDWENTPGRNHDDSGANQPSNSSITDKQVPRLAFAANAAVMPRNKFDPVMAKSNYLHNRFVRETEIKYASEVVLMTEFGNKWTVAGGPPGAGGGGAGTVVAKSHRPINVFYNGSSGYDEYNASASKGNGIRGSYLYAQRPTKSTSDPEQLYGLFRLNDLESELDQVRSFFDNPSVSEANAVGRHHPGGNDSRLGGTTNFMFVDGHVDRNTITWSLDNRKWGDRYYSMIGENRVLDFDGARTSSRFPN